MIHPNFILIDIDETITYENNDYLNDPDIEYEYFREILRDMLLKKFMLSSKLLLELKSKECIFKTPTLGIDEEVFWQEVVKSQNEHLFAYPDNVDMVKDFHI